MAVRSQSPTTPSTSTSFTLNGRPRQHCQTERHGIQCHRGGDFIHLVWRYVKEHWQGQQGLAWSFWINLVALRVLVSVLQEWLGPEDGQNFSESRILVLALALVFHGVLFVWQAVGVLRATEVYVRTSGAMAPVWGTQLATAVAFFWAITYAFGAWQMTLPDSDLLKSQAELEAERAAKYSIEPSEDGLSLAITGSLELGITKRLKDQLKANPNAAQIILSSTGGNIFEARGLAKTIQQNGLNTLVVSECSSACTTAFIGGAERRVAPGGRLGFHQYRIDADYAVLKADPAREQNRDRAVFLQSGVADWFVEKMFASTASEMWFPDISELLEANVVTETSPPDGEN